MAILEKTAPNGQVIEFDTNEFSEQEMEQYLNLPKFKNEIPQGNQQEDTTDKRNIVTDIGLSAIDGVRDGVQASIGLVEQLGDTLGEKTGFYGVGFGNGDGEFQFSDLKPDLLSYKEAQDKGIIDDKLTLPDFDKDPDTIAGGITKGVTQFLTGWFTGGKLLKGVKAVTGTGQLAKSVAKGSIADFQAFDQDTGRLTDMITEYAPELDNPITDYLESDKDDTWYEARFKNALEGAFLGGAIEGTFRGFRWYKNKKAQSKGMPHDEKLLAEDEQYLKIYHGTSAKFEDLDWRKTADGSIWFTTSKEAIEGGLVGASTKGRILERIIDENKVKLISSKDADNLLDDQVLQQGYDGIKFEADPELGTYYRIFNPEKLDKIKKAINNKPEQSLKVDKFGKARAGEVKADEIVDTYTANLKSLEDGVYSTFKTLQDENAKNGIKSKDFDELLDDMNISTQFNVKQLVDLDKDGLISEIAFAKTFKNLVRSKKIVVSDEMVERQARKLYEGQPNVLESDIARLVKELKNAPETVVGMNAYRSFLNGASKRLAKLGQKDPRAKELFQKTVFKQLRFVNSAKEFISAQTARTQRLQATSFGTQINKEQADLIKEFEMYGGDFDEFMRKFSLTGDADVTKILDYAGKSKTWDIANEIWINALLSNPKTHMINMTSNMINMFVRPLEKSIGSLTGYLGNSNKAKLLRAEGGKALGSYISMGRYLKDAVKYAGIALKKEDGILTSRNKLDTPKKSIQKRKIVDGVEVEDKSVTGTLINFAGKVVRQPSRFLTAEDEFFKQIQYRTHLERNAFDTAMKDGKSQTKIVAYDIKTKKPITEFEQAVVDNFDAGFDKFGRARNLDVLKMAEEGTYTNELTGIMKRVADLTNEFPIMKQIIPFTRTPVNLMLNVVDRTPLGFVRKQYRDDFFGRNGTERMAQSRGQLATGFALMILANKLVAEGQITGSQGQVRGEKLTNSKELRDLKKATGIIPYSFRYYDKEEQTYKYREFGRFDPFGAFFGLVVDFHTYRDQLDEETAQRAGSNTMLLLAQMGGGARDYLSGGQKLGNSISAIGSSVSRNLVSKTYLKGLADFMEVISDDEPSKWGRYAKSKAGSFIPNIYSKFINDPFYRDTKGIFDELKKRSGTAEVEFKYDFRGNALRIQGDEETRLVNGVFNPFGETTQKKDPVAKEIFRLGVNMPSMKTVLRGDIDLSLFTNAKGQTAYNRQQELLRKVRIGGQSLDQKLQSIVNSSGYKQLSDPRAVDKNNKDIGGKGKLLRKVIKDYHTAVEELLIKEANKFKSLEDETGKFTLFNSLNAMNNNLEKLKMGINITPSALNSLYQFSQ